MSAAVTDRAPRRAEIDTTPSWTTAPKPVQSASVLHTYSDKTSLWGPYEWTWAEKTTQALTAWLLFRLVRRARHHG
jgi:hypothetical protein